MNDPFGTDVVAEIAQHMNDHHAEDNVVIVRGLAGVDSATAARMSGMDADGMDFDATVNGISVPIRVPFTERLTARSQVRAETAGLYRAACAALGIAPHP